MKEKSVHQARWVLMPILSLYLALLPLVFSCPEARMHRDTKGATPAGTGYGWIVILVTALAFFLGYFLVVHVLFAPAAISSVLAIQPQAVLDEWAALPR